MYKLSSLVVKRDVDHVSLSFYPSKKMLRDENAPKKFQQWDIANRSSIRILQNLYPLTNRRFGGLSCELRGYRALEDLGRSKPDWRQRKWPCRKRH